MSRTALVEVADVAPVVLAQGVPEGVVLGVERPLGDDRLIDQRRPVDAVGRPVRVQPARAQGDRLVTLVRPAVGVRVLERREVVEPRPRPDDVVLPRAGELEQAQLGLDPVDAVPALGVAGEQSAATPSSSRPRSSGRPRCSTCGRPRRRGRPCGSRSRSPPRGRRARGRLRAARVLEPQLQAVALSIRNSSTNSSRRLPISIAPGSSAPSATSRKQPEDDDEATEAGRRACGSSHVSLDLSDFQF